MTPEAFKRQWQGVALKESASSKDHFSTYAPVGRADARRGGPQGRMVNRRKGYHPGV